WIWFGPMRQPLAPANKLMPNWFFGSTGATGGGCQVVDSELVDRLSFTGPGISGAQTVALQASTVGNSSNPSGIWQGEVTPGGPVPSSGVTQHPEPASTRPS